MLFNYNRENISFQLNRNHDNATFKKVAKNLQSIIYFLVNLQTNQVIGKAAITSAV